MLKQEFWEECEERRGRLGRARMAQDLLRARPFLALQDPSLFEAVRTTIQAAMPPLFGGQSPESPATEKRQREAAEAVDRALWAPG